jgi:hypothetical protein
MLTNLPKNTRILVSDDGKLWLRRYLHHTEPSLSNPDQVNAIVYPMGCDSWSYENFNKPGMCPRLTVWTQWKVWTGETE